MIGFGPAAPFDSERDLFLEHLAAGHFEGMGWITPERARLSCNPDTLLPGARSIVALGTAYTQPEVASDGGRLMGRVARYGRGRDYHDVIRPRLKALADFVLEACGPEMRCRLFVDTGPLLDRAAAHRSGVGFVGKNTCVLTGPHGSYVFLSAILTTAELTPDALVTKDCGSCRACIDACPTGALVAPGELDATQCISYLTIENRGSIPRELRPRIGQWVFGCDVCQEVCPWNRARAPRAHREYAGEQGAGAELDLIELLGMDEERFWQRFRRTPLKRAKRGGLLRNAAVVLGNLGDPAAEPALTAALQDPNPLVREHAAWALGQLANLTPPSRRAVQAALAAETGPSARRDIERLAGV